MRLVIDTNIVLSALLKPDSFISSILINPGIHQFHAPGFLKDEVVSKMDRIVALSDKSEEVLTKAYDILVEKIEFHDIESLERNIMLKAFDLVADVDINDLPFVALTLGLDEAYLLTGDKKLIRGLNHKGFDICKQVKDLKK